jgi:hypothetical protein
MRVVLIQKVRTDDGMAWPLGPLGAVASTCQTRRHHRPSAPPSAGLSTSPILAPTLAIPMAQGTDVGKIHVSFRARADGWSSLRPPSVLKLVSACRCLLKLVAEACW